MTHPFTLIELDRLHQAGEKIAMLTCYDASFAALAEMAGVEYLLIDRDTTIPEFKKELRWNEVYYHLARGF